MNNKPDIIKNNETAVNVLNNIQSDKNATAGEGEIKAFDEVFPNYQPREDTDEISSTDDV